MFGEFSVNLCVQLMRANYAVPQTTAAEFSKIPYYSAKTVQMGSLINLFVFNAAKVSPEQIVEFNEQACKQAQNVLTQAAHVTLIYIIYGGLSSTDYKAAEFAGQKLYSVFWTVCPDTGAISHATGQPKDLFSLASMIRAAATATERADTNALFSAHQSINKSVQKKHEQPLLTYAIILINAFVMLLMYQSGFPDDFLVPMHFGAIMPHLILDEGEWYRLLTAIFIHFGVAHLAANTLGIFIFGSRIEKYLGRGVFFATYIITGVCGSVASLYFSSAYAAGASGAVYGLVGMLFVYTRITKRSLEFVDWYLMLMYIGVGVAMGFATTGVDNFAHLGGLVAGMAAGLVYAMCTRKTRSEV